MTKAEEYAKLDDSEVALPSDFTLKLPNMAHQWLAKYSIHPQELMEHLIGYSENLQRLIFPVYDSNKKLLMWTGRYFGRKMDEPRYRTMGNKNSVVHIVGENPLKQKVIITEDIVSAIKVGRLHPSMPLFGANMPLEHATRLSSRFREVVMWLDPNMKVNALKQAIRLEPWFHNVSVILSDRDPKDHSDKEILEKLGD